MRGFILSGFIVLIFSGCAHNSMNYDVVTNIPYVENGGERQQGDLYIPQAEKEQRFPVALVIHGGGWSGRDRTDMNDISERLAGSGFVVLNINYRLAPEHRYPAQLHDVQSAISFLNELETDYPADLQRVMTVGYSAGAHLALLAAAQPGDGFPPVRAVIAGGAPVDLTRYPDSPYVQELMGFPFDENPEGYKAASPLYQIHSQFPPVFLYHGRLDTLVGFENSRLMREALMEQGTPVELHARPVFGHILTYFFEGSSITRGIDFVKGVLD